MFTGTADKLLDTRPKFYHRWHEGEDVRMPHSTTLKPVAWYVPYEEKMDGTGAPATGVKYKPNMKMGYLREVYLMHTTPAIYVRSELKDKIQIRLCDNPGHKLIKNAVANIGSLPPSFTGKCLDAIRGRTLSGDMKDEYYKAIGNIPELTTWSNYLPSKVLTIPLPYFFCDSSTRGLPLWRMEDGQCVFINTYNPYSSIIQMRQRKGDAKESKKDEDWELIEFNKNFISDNIVGDSEMYAFYSKVEEDEIKAEMECGAKSKLYDIVTYSSYESKNYNQLGETAEIRWTTQFPIRGIYFMAESKYHEKRNCHSKYTLPGSGGAICSSFSMKIGSTDVFPENTPIDRAGFVTSWYHTKKPGTPGIHFVSFVDNYPSPPLSHDISLNTGGIQSEFFVKLESNSKQDEFEQFKLHLHTVEVHTLEFVIGSDGKNKLIIDAEKPEKTKEEQKS